MLDDDIGASLILSSKNFCTSFSYDGQAYGTAPTVGNLTTLSKWDNVTNSWISAATTYDAYGNVATTTDPRGKVTQIFYEDSTHALPTRVVVDPQNGTGAQTSTSTFDYYTGAVLSQTDPNGNVSTIDYTNQLLGTVDPFGRAGTVYTPAVLVNGTSQRHKTTTTYLDNQRQVIVASDLNAEGDELLKTRSTQDELGRSVLVEQSEDGTNYTISSQTVYEQMGKVTYQSNPHRSVGALTDGWTRATKDVLGRVTEVAIFSGSTRPAHDTACDTARNCTGRVLSSYDSNQTTVEDQAGKSRRSFVNALGQLVRVDEPDASNNLGSVGSPAQATSYTYDVLGNLTQVNQGAQTRTFSYSSLSRLTSASNPESGTISYTYDANGNLQTKIDARGVVTTYAYDALNRATSRSYSDFTPTVTYAYDTATNGKGRLTSVSSSVSANSYSGYDALGRATGSSQTTDSQTYQMSYGYNLAGALTTETYPSGRIVTTSYDNAGRLSQVTGQKMGEANKTYASQMSYAASGAMTDLKLGNNLWEHSNFNSRLQPTEIGLGTAQSGIDRLKINYSYGTTDNNGNVQSQTITVPSGPTLQQSYTYDELNRLKVAQENSGASWKQTFIYDRFGNRTFDTNNTTTNALGSLLTIDQSNNRFTSGQGAILYDQTGNLTRDFNGHSFGYDAENKQTTYDGGATVGGGANYAYDGDGRRVKKVNGGSLNTTIFVYDAAGQMVAEYTTASLPSNGGGTSYLTSDNLGTPRIITDSSGSVKSRHDYAPFGEELGYNPTLNVRNTQQGYAGDNVRQKFTKKERDIETGLDYFGARYYANTQGRFTSPDPLFGSGRIENPQTWNRYDYVLGNPLKFCDPLGLFEYLAGTSPDDIKRINKAYDALVTARGKYKVGSKEYEAIDKSLTVLGAPGQKNNVFVSVDNGLKTPGVTYSSPEYDGNGKVNGSQSVVSLNLNDFAKNDLGNAQLAGALGHEGTHVADAQSEATRLTGKTILEMNDLAANGGIMSKAITEVHAYRVSAYIAAAITPSNIVNSKFNGNEIWNRGWRAPDAVTQREAGIRGELESPNGPYKYKFSSTNAISIAVPGLNNALDTASRWTVNGGAILQ